MKLKSLFLGSVAAVGLSTSAFAADVAADVLTSLDVCDALGISGLTISSETNCLQISGGVDYRFRYGNYRSAIVTHRTYAGNGDQIAPDSYAGNAAVAGLYIPAAGGAAVAYNAGDVVPAGAQIVRTAEPARAADPDRDLDWDSRSRAWINVIAAADSDFGPARAHITLRQVEEWRVRNEGFSSMVNGLPGAVVGGDHTNGVVISEAFVSVGDSTVLMAGKKADKVAGSVANIGDDNPYSFLFISDQVDGGGVLIEGDDRRLGGHSIQITSDLGNGFAVSAGLENLDTGNFGAEFAPGTFAVENDSNLEVGRTRADQAGTAIGVLEYSGEGISAHVTGIAYGVLDGTVEEWAVHAGASGTFDMFKVTGAVGYSSNYQTQGFSVLHGLLSAEGTFDMFTVGVSGEFASASDDVVATNGVNPYTDYSVSGDIGFAVTEGVSLNLEGAYFRDGYDNLDTYRVRASVAAEITETLTVAAGIGGFFGNGVAAADENVIFGDIGLTWAPGGNFTSGLKLEANDEGAYRTEFTASKTFD